MSRHHNVIESLDIYQPINIPITSLKTPSRIDSSQHLRVSCSVQIHNSSSAAGFYIHTNYSLQSTTNLGGDIHNYCWYLSIANLFTFPTNIKTHYQKTNQMTFNTLRDLLRHCKPCDLLDCGMCL